MPSPDGLTPVGRPVYTLQQLGRVRVVWTCVVPNHYPTYSNQPAVLAVACVAGG